MQKAGSLSWLASLTAFGAAKALRIPIAHLFGLSAPVMHVVLTPPHSEPTRQDAWSQHWSTGVLHACTQGAGGTLSDGFVRFWRPVLRNVAAESRVLDLGTGNGVLPLSAWSWLNPCRLEFDAIDLAELRPNWVNRLPEIDRQRIRFHSRVRMEDLPFAARSFDLITSQFALEYADRQAAVAEVRRVAKPGASMALVCHHAGSLPVRLAATEISHIDSLLRTEGLIDLAEMLAPRFAQSTSEAGRLALQADSQARANRQRFDELQHELDLDVERSDCPDIVHETRHSIIHAFQLSAMGRVEDSLLYLHSTRTKLMYARVRLAELRAHALTPRDADELLRDLQVADGAQWTPLQEQGAVMAWSLQARFAV